MNRRGGGRSRCPSGPPHERGDEPDIGTREFRIVRMRPTRVGMNRLAAGGHLRFGCPSHRRGDEP
jgi:hypothetical protein